MNLPHAEALPGLPGFVLGGEGAVHEIEFASSVVLLPEQPTGDTFAFEFQAHLCPVNLTHLDCCGFIRVEHQGWFLFAKYVLLEGYVIQVLWDRPGDSSGEGTFDGVTGRGFTDSATDGNLA